MMPSVLWRCWLGGRKGIRPVKNWVVGCWHGYLSGARCRLAYGPAMLLPLTVSCFSKIQIGFIFLVPAHLGSPGKRAVKWVCVCGSMYTVVLKYIWNDQSMWAAKYPLKRYDAVDWVSEKTSSREKPVPLFPTSGDWKGRKAVMLVLLGKCHKIEVVDLLLSFVLIVSFLHFFYITDCTLYDRSSRYLM